MMAANRKSSLPTLPLRKRASRPMLPRKRVLGTDIIFVAHSFISNAELKVATGVRKREVQDKSKSDTELVDVVDTLRGPPTTMAQSSHNSDIVNVLDDSLDKK